MGGVLSDETWGGAPSAASILLIATVLAAHDTRLAIEASGARIAATVDLALAAGGLDDYPDTDVIVLETEGADDETLAAALDAIADRAARGDAVIVGFTTDQLDQVAAAMLGNRVQLLCAPDAADRAAALAIALAGARPGRLREDDPQSEAARLKRLNDELARIADLLARMGRVSAPPPALGDRSQTFGIEDEPGAVDPADIRRAIRARRMREQFFGGGLFEDPAWDILLDLFAADLEGKRVSVSSLCIAAAVPPTTALRWIGRMSEEKLLVREPDPADRRRAFMRLGSGARGDMQRYWRVIQRLGGPLV